MIRVGLLCLVVFGVADVSGRYEVQSLGADREMTLTQKGVKLVAHRVMWPEFEGAKYKLEHMYKGTLSGNQIKGKLFVKDDESPKYEELRDFTGVVGDDGTITLDGLPLKKLDGKASDAPAAESDEGERPSVAPSLS